MPLPKGPPSPTAEAFGTIFFRGMAAEPRRLERWVSMAHRVFGSDDDPHMGFQLQQAGFLDILLLAFEAEARTDPGPDYSKEYIAGQSFEFVFGDCWLLFVYEVLRTFRGSEQSSALPDDVRRGLEQIFRLVSLVRMPIAKHEAAKTRRGTSYIFNTPIRIMHDGHSTAGWRVFDKSTGTMVDILRRPLADALLLCSEGTLSESHLKAIMCGGSRELIAIVKD